MRVFEVCGADSRKSSVFDQSLEDLLKVKVSSVSEKSEEFSRTASTIHVITTEDIRRRGATVVMNAL